VGVTQPPTQWISGAVSPGIKWLGREADHSLPSSVEVKKYVDLYIHSHVRLDGVKHSDSFTFGIRTHPPKKNDEKIEIINSRETLNPVFSHQIFFRQSL
jgi:hypothetical protein